MFKRLLSLVALVTVTALSSHAANPPTVASVVTINAKTQVQPNSKITVTVTRYISGTQTVVPNAPVDWQWYGAKEWTNVGNTNAKGVCTFDINAPSKAGTYTLCVQSGQVSATGVTVKRAYGKLAINVSKK